MLLDPGVDLRMIRDFGANSINSQFNSPGNKCLKGPVDQCHCGKRMEKIQQETCFLQVRSVRPNLRVVLMST